MSNPLTARAEPFSETAPQGDITLAALGRSLRRGWKIITALVVVATLAAAVITKFQTPIFVASLRVTPSDEMKSPGGLAGLLGGNSTPKSFAEFVALLHSNRLGARLLADPALIHDLFGKGLRNDGGRWFPTTRPPLSARIHDQILSWFGIHPQSELTPIRMAGFLAGSIRTIQDRDGTITTISATALRPDLALKLLTAAVSGADSILKREQAKRLQSQTDYLTGRLRDTTNLEYRTFLISALGETEKELMKVEYSGSYSYFALDEPAASPTPFRPRPVFNIAIGFGLGLFLGLVFVIFRDGLKGLLSE